MVLINLNKYHSTNNDNNDASLPENQYTRAMMHTYFRILNAVNPDENSQLTEAEIKLLTEFILLPEKYSYQRFSRYAKPIVLESLKVLYDWKLTSVNLNSKIYELINKKFLWRDIDGVIYIKKWILESTNKLLKDRQILISLGKEA